MRLQVYNLQAQIQTLLWIMFPWTLRTWYRMIHCHRIPSQQCQ
jgi:hypothetical protein